MDTERFELTRAEILNTHRPKDGFPLDPDREFYRRLLKAQVSKVLSLLEPVELEPLGDEGIKSYMIYEGNEFGNQLLMWGGKVSQATIKKNQAKGQLYRIRE